MARMYVSLEKLQRAAQLIDALADLDQPGKLPEIVLPGVADLVGCDIVTYNEIPTAPGQAGYYLEYPHGCITPAGLMAFEAHLQEHPLLIHYRAGGAGEPAKISDFLSNHRFHRLGLYSEFFRHIPVEYQIAFSLPHNQDGQLTAIALNRAGRDFSEDDRAVLKALSAPLGNALRRARDRHSAGAALATAGSDGLADLTDREIQVLQLAARGRTNLAIARTFDVSPRTVAKHLEHIYRKLGVTSRAAAVYRTTAMGQASGTLRLSHMPLTLSPDAGRPQQRPDVMCADRGSNYRLWAVCPACGDLRRPLGTYRRRSLSRRASVK
jgi:DNA-binding CsgD family transcriptional regulator